MKADYKNTIESMKSVQLGTVFQNTGTLYYFFRMFQGWGHLLPTPQDFSVILYATSQYVFCSKTFLQYQFPVFRLNIYAFSLKEKLIAYFSESWLVFSNWPVSWLIPKSLYKGQYRINVENYIKENNGVGKPFNNEFRNKKFHIYFF